MKKQTAVAVAAGALALPTAAQAHVSVHPNVVPAGANATLNLRVPNEQDKASTVGVDIQVPPGFLDVSVGDPNWKVKLGTQKLAKPVHTDDGTVTEEVRTVSLTAKPGAGIAPGYFGQIPLAVEIPDDDAGKVLTFKVVQTYSNGQKVRWIGTPDSDTPAPTIDVTKTGGVIEDASGSEAGPPATPPDSTASKPTETKTEGASKGLGIAALIVGALGLLAGLAALATRRRAPGS